MRATEEQHNARKREIMEKCFECYAENGLTGTGIKALAAACGCTTGNLYSYFSKEKEPFRIFVYADAESKLKRCRERSPENENLSDSKIRKNIRSIDKGRARYYNYFSRQKWGSRENYDLLINTSGKDVKQVSEAVADYLKRYLFE